MPLSLRDYNSNNYISDDKFDLNNKIRISDSPSYRITISLITNNTSNDGFDSLIKFIKKSLTIYDNLFDIKVDSRLLFFLNEEIDNETMTPRDCLDFLEAQSSLFPNLIDENNINFIIQRNHEKESILFSSEGKGGFLKSRQMGGEALEDGEFILERLYFLFMGTFKSISSLEEYLLNERISKSKSILLSLQRLLSSFPEIRVNKNVKKLMEGVVDAIKESGHGDLENRLRSSSRSLQMATEMFFDPSMMANQYFPIEHMLGVYLPIFFPFMLPLVVQFGIPLIPWFHDNDDCRGGSGDGGGGNILVIEDSLPTLHGSEIFLDHLMSHNISKKGRIIFLSFGGRKPCIQGRIDERTLIVRRMLSIFMVKKDNLSTIIPFIEDILKVKTLLGGSSTNTFVVLEAVHMSTLLEMVSNVKELLCLLEKIISLIRGQGCSLIISYNSLEKNILFPFLSYRANSFISFSSIPSGLSQSSYGKLKIILPDLAPTEYVWCIGKDVNNGSKNGTMLDGEDVLLLNRII